MVQGLASTFGVQGSVFRFQVPVFGVGSFGTSVHRGTSLIRNCHSPIGPPQGPRHRPTKGSQEEEVSYERSTPLEGAGGSLRNGGCGFRLQVSGSTPVWG